MSAPLAEAPYCPKGQSYFGKLALQTGFTGCGELAYLGISALFSSGRPNPQGGFRTFCRRRFATPACCEAKIHGATNRNRS